MKRFVLRPEEGDFRKLFRLAILAFVIVILTNCSRDPNVRKLKYYNSATQYFEKGKYNEASIELRNAIRIDPRYADAHFLISQTYLKMGLVNEGIQELRTTVDLAPQNWKAQIDLGNMFYMARQFDKANEKAQMVLSHDPQNADAHELLANVEAAQGHPDQALSEMNKSVKLAPSASKYINLAVLQSKANSTGAAEESLKKAISLDPKKAAPTMALGAFYVQQHRLDEAEKQFRHAIELEPKNPAAHKQLILMYLIEGQKDKAEQAAVETKQDMKEISEGYRTLGDFYQMTGQQDKAFAEYASLCHEHPDDLIIKKIYIGMLAGRNQVAEAAKLNDEILKENPHDVGGLLESGLIFIRQGRANDAIAPLQAVLKIEPDNGIGHYYLGLAYNQLSKPDLAEIEWHKAAQLRPNSADVQQGLAEFALRRGDYSQLEQSAEALIKLTPSSPLGYVYHAAVKASRKDIPGTEADLKLAIKVAPKNPLGYARLGELMTSEHKLKEAEQAFEEALQYGPGFGEAMAGLIRVFLIQKEPAKAIARVNQQIAKAPNSSELNLLLGELLADSSDLAKAEDALQKSTDLDSKNIDAFVLLTQVQKARGSIDRAIITCQRNIHENPRDVRSYVQLGVLEEAQGNWQGAQDVYKKAMQVEPDQPVAANDLAYLMLTHGGNFDVALSLAQTARRGLPEAPGVADTLAWAYYKKGVYDTAIDLLKEALKKNPNDAAYHYHLGMAYREKKDRTNATEQLERALKIDPKFPKADEIKQALASLAKG
ncbi:MAG: tetratricopeptide repeat protein [Terriglobia bacterium]